MPSTKLIARTHSESIHGTEKEVGYLNNEESEQVEEVVLLYVCSPC